MPKFSANLSFLFQEVPFLERFELAAAAGFCGVEYLFPYDWPAEEIAARLRQHQLVQVLFNLPAGDWAAGERGLACQPGREDEFSAQIEQAARYAQALDCQRVHCMSGLRPVGAEPELVRATYIANLRRCADRLAPLGVQVLIEPINSRIDMPDYWLDDVDQAFALRAEIERPNVAVQYDLYHARVLGDPLAQRLATAQAQIGHLQLADFPGRHEPGTGDIDFAPLFAQLDRQGYAGWIGCEYRPSSSTQASLAWMTQS